MRFEQLLHLIGNLPWFDFATVLQLSGEPRQNLRVRLYEWRKAGKLITLRRGMYTLAAPYRRVSLHPALLSNHLYTPSYLSTHWALSFHGLIPEKTVIYTAVTSRVPRRFENSFGLYQYSNVKLDFFFGYREVEMDSEKVLVATPEKALLDLWHLNSGEWGVDRMHAMRFQNFDVVSIERLLDDAERFGKPRLSAAISAWQQMQVSIETGTVLL
jgi:predicted transcriptional regulator of viral defense system